MEPSFCQNLRAQYERVKELTNAFEAAHKRFRGIGELQEAKRLKEQAELAEKELREILDYPYFHPDRPRSVVKKTNYCEVGRLSLTETRFSSYFQVLPDERVVCGDSGGRIHIWQNDKTSGDLFHELLVAHKKEITFFRVFPDGRIVSGSLDSTISVLKKNSDGKWGSTVLTGHKGGISQLIITPDGRIISGDDSGAIHVWTEEATNQWKTEALFGHKGKVRALLVLPDGRIVSGGHDSTVRVWRKVSENNYSWEILDKHKSRVVQLKLFPDGKIISCDPWNSIVWKQRPKDGWDSALIEDTEIDYPYQLIILSSNRFAYKTDRSVRIWEDVGEMDWQIQVKTLIPKLDNYGLDTFLLLPDARVITACGHRNISKRAIQILEKGKGDGGWNTETLSIKNWDGGRIPAMQITPAGKIYVELTDDSIRIFDGDV